MLVTLVLLNLFTTIALYYTMTVSKLSDIGTSGNPAMLNLAMVFAIVIAFMWVVALILFYEFKTDDAIKTQIHSLESQISELNEFKKMLKETVYTPAVINPDVMKDGGITGHTVPSTN
jgi:hypothetical protein